MGSSSSTPVVQPPRVRDSVVIRDGLPPFEYGKHAASPCGRFVFVVEHKSDIYFEGQVPDAFDFDIIDLFLAKRTRVRIGDFFNYSIFCGLYALDERTVIVVDYEPTCNTLRQRVIRIDRSRSTAECPLYRGYTIRGLSVPFLVTCCHLPAKTAASKDWAVTVVPNREHDSLPVNIKNLAPNQSAFLYPSNPLSLLPPWDITNICDIANFHVLNMRPPGEDGAARISTLHAPFFLPTGELGFFVDPNDTVECVDPMSILIMDPNSEWGDARIEEATCPAHFPLAEERPFWARWTQANDDEIVMLYKLKRSNRYWSVMNWINNALAWPLNKLTAFFNRRGWWRLQLVVTVINMVVAAFRWIMLLEHEETKCAVLDTSSLHWTEMKGTWRGGWLPLSEKIIRLGEDFIIASETYDAGPSRVIGREGGQKKSKMEQFRLIGQPTRMSSLARLCALAVQRNGHRVPADLLEQIEARVL